MRLAVLVLTVACSSTTFAADWLSWRGPSANNYAAAGEQVPVNWGPSKNVVWQTPVPGRGHATPIFVGNRIYLATADESDGTQAVVAFDRSSGKMLETIPIHKGSLPPKIHPKNTHASPTVACDGSQLYVVFNNANAVWASALTLNGKLVWQKRVAGFTPKKYQFGYGPSPILYKGQLIVTSEYDGPDSGIYALNTGTGEQVWKAARPKLISFSTPVVAKVAGKDQLLISGCFLIAAYDPTTGNQLWQTKGTTQATCGTMVWSGDLVFASGGYPDAGTFAVKADGSGQVAWQNRIKCYEQSMLAHNGYIYGLADSGVAYCWKASDGEEMWKARLKGPVSASPLLVGDKIYVSNELGTTYVLKASPDRFELIAENRLGNSSFASPVVIDNRLYLRHASGDGASRRESLYCIGE